MLNRDDEYGRALEAPSQDPSAIGTAWAPNADLRARHISSGFQGLRFDVQFGKLRFAVESPLIGKINVYNILAACGAGLSYGIAPETIARGIAELRAVPGRFERVDEGQPFVVVVDYAHTDDALRNVIAVARGLNPKRVITLFGCGGDRDRTKRPLMGQAAAEASDFVVLTSDNPRSEDPLAIMNDALVGIRRVDVPHVVEPDRAAAIARALKEAREGDIVILAGKGHETYQILKDKTIHVRRPGGGERSAEGVSGITRPESAMTLDLQEVASAMGAAGHAACEPVAGWSVDTRTQQPGDVYFALRGPNHDGHDSCRAASGRAPRRWWWNGRTVRRAESSCSVARYAARPCSSWAPGRAELGWDGGRRYGQRRQDHHQGRHRASALRRTCRSARPSAISITTWACRFRSCGCRTTAAPACSKWA